MDNPIAIPLLNPQNPAQSKEGLCPHCQKMIPESVYEPDTRSWMLCGGLCGIGCICGFCLIPLFVKKLQKQKIFCMNCMKYLDNYKEEDSQIIVESNKMDQRELNDWNTLAKNLNLDPFTLTQAQVLFSHYVQVANVSEIEQMKLIARCAVLISNRLHLYQSIRSQMLLIQEVPLNTIVQDCDLHKFFYFLKDILQKNSSLDQNVKLYIQKILGQFAFGVTIYHKFVEIWKSYTDYSHQLGWITFCQVRINLLRNNQNFSVTAYYLIAVIQSTLPLQINLKVLCQKIKADIKGAQIAIQKFQEFKSVKSDLDWNNAKQILQDYRRILGNNQLDFTLLLNMTQNARETFNEMSPNGKSTQLLQGMNKITLAQFHNRSNTPVSLSLEMSKWLKKKIKYSDVIQYDLIRLSGSDYQQIIVNMQQYQQQFQLLLEQHDIESQVQEPDLLNYPIQSSQATLSLPQKVGHLYCSALTSLLQKEEEKMANLKQSNLESLKMILNNSIFHKSLLTCCAETVLLINNITNITIEQLLQLINLQPFDLWKLINNYAQFDKNIPRLVKLHFRELELLILSHLGWQKDGYVAQTLTRLSCQSNKIKIPPQFKMFHKRAAQHAASRILELGDSIQASNFTKERIWQCIKYIFNSIPEIMIERHLDQIILCCVFGVYKSLSQKVSFKYLIQKHIALYQTPQQTFENVMIREGEHQNIINFYNSIFIDYTKYFLTGDLQDTSTLSKDLKIQGSLQENVPTGYSPKRSPLLSPFLMTPRTKRLYAFVDSTSSNILGSLEDTRKISFRRDEPKPKKAKHLAEILHPEKDPLAFM